MKRFVFSMQKLLETKEALEEAAQRRLANAIRALELSREELCKMNSMLNDITCKIDGLMRAKETDKHGILVHSRYKSLLEGMIRRQENAVEGHKRDVELLREKLNKAMAERKSLESLKNIERKRWAEDVRREEQKSLDEVSLLGFMKRKNEMPVI